MVRPQQPLNGDNQKQICQNQTSNRQIDTSPSSTDNKYGAVEMFAAPPSRRPRLASTVDVFVSPTISAMHSPVKIPSSSEPAPPPRSAHIKTKITCTIGPKTQSVEQLGKLVQAGMNVARMNFSHGSLDFHLKTIENLRQWEAEEVTKGARKPVVAIMLDTKGPEIRTGRLETDTVHLAAGQQFFFDCTEIGYKEGKGNDHRVPVSYDRLPYLLHPGDTIMVDDGLLCFRVISIDLDQGFLETRLENSGDLGENKGVNLPGVHVDLPALTEKDKRDIEFGIKNGIDFVAASFIRSGQDVHDIREFMRGLCEKLEAEGTHPYPLPHIISKIENQQGLDHFADILSASDGIMVARGDLGVEIPVEQVFRAQKWMIAQCNAAGKPCITATQMLESMIVNPRPTRAEVTDVANAVLDGSDSVMLSGETAKGAYPIKTVETMARICRAAEADINYGRIYTKEHITSTGSAENTPNIRPQKASSTISPIITTPLLNADTLLQQVQSNPGLMFASPVSTMSVHEAIAAAAVKTSWEVQAACIIALTETGRMARCIAHLRPIPPVLAITASLASARLMQVLRGVYALVVRNGMTGTECILQQAMLVALEDGMVVPGDPIVITSGVIEAHSGSTNMLRVLRCPQRLEVEAIKDFFI